MTATMNENPTAISQDIRESVELSRFVDETRAILREEIGLQYPTITERWELATPKSFPPVVRMTIGDDFSEVGVLLNPSWANDTWRLRNTINSTWRELLLQSVRHLRTKLDDSFKNRSEN